MTMTHEQWREHPYYKCDPFADDIQPALLNYVDIKKYVEKDCLIENEDFDDNRLKTASYEMRFLGKLYDWNRTDDGRLQKRCRKIYAGCEITLCRNSITYLWMKEKLLLPGYIAARFNLHIRHVHKGILLGTGPLVDPGFSGNLLIPLHNLTDNNYKLKGGEGLIWVEFTKISKNDDPKFPYNKDLDDPDLYFIKSGVTEVGGVQSAFQGALEKTQSAAESAEKSAVDAREKTKRLQNLFTWIGVGSMIAIMIAVVAAIFGGYNLVNQVVEISTEVHRQIKIDREAQSKEIDSIRKIIVDLEEKIDKYRVEMEALKRQSDLVNKEQETGRNVVE